MYKNNAANLEKFYLCRKNSLEVQHVRVPEPVEGPASKTNKMETKDYYKGLNIAITISAKDGEILYQNDSSIEVNGDARGRDLMKCHNERSQQIIQHLLDDAATNVYTISKKGKKKLIYQTPWYEDDAKQVVGGLIEFSIILPDEMPHYDRG